MSDFYFGKGLAPELAERSDQSDSVVGQLYVFFAKNEAV